MLASFHMFQLKIKTLSTLVYFAQEIVVILFYENIFGNIFV